VFVVWWVSALTTLAIWPIYALSRHLWRRRRAGMASVLLWVTAYSGLRASDLPAFSADAVALPWLFLTVHLTLTAVGTDVVRRFSRGLMAGGACWLTLALWPAAMWLLLLMMVLAAAIDYHHLTVDLVTEPVPGGTPRTLLGRAIYGPATLVGLGIVGAGLSVPSLQARGVAWSMPVIFGGAWVLLGFALRRVRLPLPPGWRLLDDAAKLMPRAFRWRRRLVPSALWLLSFGLLLAGAVLTRWLTRSKLADFPVLLQLVWEKLVHFGQMPLVPHVLSDDVRWLWTHGFPGPEVSALWGSALGLLLLTPPAMVLPFIQVRHAAGAGAIASGARLVLPFGRAILVGLTGSLAGLWVLAAPLDGWFAWAAAVTAGSLVDLALNVGRYPPLWRLGARPKIFAVMLLTGGMLTNLAGAFFHTAAEELPPRSYVLSLIKQVRSRTEPDAPVVAPASLSGVLAADTGRPMVACDDVLSGAGRRRLQEYGRAMFGTEEELAAFCGRLGARYVVLDAATALETSAGRLRYDSNHLMMSTNSAAYRSQFEPEKLKRFRLIYTGPLHRLYQCGQGWQAHPLAAAYYPTWDRGNYSSDRLRLLTDR
jgi:hypothetical protein